MSSRPLLLVALVTLAFTVVSVFVIDVPLARLIGTPPSNGAAWNHAFTAAMEIAFGMTLSKFALGAALIGAGVVAYAVRRWRLRACRCCSSVSRTSPRAWSPAY